VTASLGLRAPDALRSVASNTRLNQLYRERLLASIHRRLQTDPDSIRLRSRFPMAAKLAEQMAKRELK
jgi:hypothetical protein